MTATFEIEDEKFKDLVVLTSVLTRLSSGHLWTEGPVWIPAHNCLYFSDIPNQRIHRWSSDGAVTAFRENSKFANGNTLDRSGRLVTCEHGSRSVSRTNYNGEVETIASQFEGRALNSPNDVVVCEDGTIWFTDPTYGIMSNYEGFRSLSEQSTNNVFKLDPETRQLEIVEDTLAQPNGLAFSTDFKKIYIADSGMTHNIDVKPAVYEYDVIEGGLTNKRVFALIAPGVPDGLRVDNRGNVWVSSADSVQCYSANGSKLGRIMVPEIVSNLEFGGPRNTQLFITANTSLYSIHVNVEGAGKLRRLN